jgi:hypothetical protein
MASIGLTGLILIPLLSGVTLLGALLLTPPTRKRRSAGQSIVLVVTGLATVSAIVLAFNGEQNVPFQLTWLPNAGPMTFALSRTGLYAALATTAAAFLALLIARLPVNSSSGLLLLTLAAANTAFLSGHFLGRYVALEVVGVCIALAPLLILAKETGPRLASFVYLVLRVGDTGFLTAMLILMNTAGTLDIGPALDSGAALSAPRLTWVIVGFVLAVWVKTSAWPFEGWQRIGEQLDFTAHAWTYATVMPNLGLYLLYRITPLLSQHLALRAWVLWLSLGGIALVTVIALVKRNLRPALVYLNAAQAGLALCLAAAGLPGLVATLLVVMTPLRLLFLWGSNTIQAEAPRQRRVASAFIGAGGATLIGFNAYLVWQLAATALLPWPAILLLAVTVMLIGGRYLVAAGSAWQHSVSPPWEPATPPQVQRLDSGLFKLAQGLRTWFEIGFLERVIKWTPRFFLGVAELLHRVVEQQGLEGMLRGTTKSVLALSEWVQARHTGRLRANLQWVFGALLVIIAILVWQGW